MRILATAFAVNPYKESEEGTGWNLIKQIAKHNYVIAITRKKNQRAIENYMQEHPNPIYDNMEFAYFDLPFWERFWKQGWRENMLHFYLWRLFVPLFILSKRFKFDVTHALNFCNDWTPSFLWALGKPFVWGPIGHHPKIPAKYVLCFFGKYACIKNQISWFLKICFWKFDPFLKITKLKADSIIAINNSVQKQLELNPNKVTIMPAVAFKSHPISDIKKDAQFTILTIGELEPIKGTDIALKSYAQFYHALKDEQKSQVVLKIIGNGKYNDVLKQLTATLKIEHAVEFVEWKPKVTLDDCYQTADVFLFPSYEDPGMVVPEALSYGVPIICFENYGSGELADCNYTININYSNYNDNIVDFAEALNDLYTKPQMLQQLSVNARNYYLNNLSWEVKAEQFNSIYTKIINRGKGNHIVYTPAKRLQWQSFSAPSNY